MFVITEQKKRNAYIIISTITDRKQKIVYCADLEKLKTIYRRYIINNCQMI